MDVHTAAASVPLLSPLLIIIPVEIGCEAKKKEERMISSLVGQDGLRSDV